MALKKIQLSGNETWANEAKKHGDRKGEAHFRKNVKRDNAKAYLKRMVRPSVSNIAKNYTYKKGLKK